MSHKGGGNCCLSDCTRGIKQVCENRFSKSTSTTAFPPQVEVKQRAWSTMASEEPRAKKQRLSEEKKKQESPSKKTPAKLR